MSTELMSRQGPLICPVSGSGSQVGQYTGAWMRFARCCHPARQAFGQAGAAFAAALAEPESSFSAEQPAPAARTTTAPSVASHPPLIVGARVAAKPENSGTETRGRGGCGEADRCPDRRR